MIRIFDIDYTILNLPTKICDIDPIINKRGTYANFYDDSKFYDDVQKCLNLGDGVHGFAYNKFIETIHEQIPYAIVTARGHTQNGIICGLRLLHESFGYSQYHYGITNEANYAKYRALYPTHMGNIYIPNHILKRFVIDTIIKENHYKILEFYDDDIMNIREVSKLAEKYQDIDIRLYTI